MGEPGALGLRRRGDGDKTGQIIKGMNLRVHGDENPSSCVSPNDWSSFPDFERDDPRIVPVFITPFGTFQSTGQENVPVTGFATFYVTGWDGSQSDLPHGRSVAFQVDRRPLHQVRANRQRRLRRGGALRHRRAGLLRGGADQMRDNKEGETHANHHT